MNLPQSQVSNKYRRLIRKLEPAFYIAPAFVVLTVVLLYPLGYALWLSFHEWTLRTFKQGIPFIGFQNYTDLFSNPDFLNSIKITFTFVFLAISFEFILGMGLALLLNQDSSGQ
jgi:ABC-type sugar transport system permease subunit